MSVALPLASAREVAHELRRSLPRGWWRLPSLIVVVLAAAASGVVGPLALGVVVDAIGAGEDAPPLAWTLAAVMAGAVVTGAVLTAVGMVSASQLFETALADLRERMVDTALHLPPARVERAGTGDLIARAGDDVAQVSDAIPRVVPALVGAAFTIAVTVVGMAVIDPWYAVALVAITPLHVFAVRRYLRHAPGVYAAERAAMAERAQHLLDTLRGLETVRAYRTAPSHLDRISTASWAVVRWSMRARGIQNLFFARLNAAEFLGMAGLLVVGFILVANGHGSVGGTTAAMLLFLRLFGPINELLFVVDDLQSALASLSRIVGVIRTAAPRDAAGEPSREHNAVEPRDIEPRDIEPRDVDLRGITHAYEANHAVLNDVSLRIAAGESVAVVGASGAGKSTLAAIAAGVHDPLVGQVDRPRSVALVTQEVHVFDADLRDNLTLAAPQATDDEVRAALRRVGGESIAARLTRGLDEPVGASGTPLSPSEAQHLALARVLLADPAFVVLDEATAEAGSAEAGRLEDAALAAIEGRTALVVAHRLSQAAASNRVVLLDAGRVREEGTHDDLRTAGGAYARLWDAWSRSR
ncbi:ABC transporter ATP-binding protein [Microbacterium sp. Kw_RZR3]|uniref:ABC transporter ATP-binding protein n=1 Tax=unclassified Microbacterium TaxID=2609290 RepID=UPI0023D98391|nr:ABC transporter ATP-binding protein [Microbacterium sp. Kw_RZR3]MDF2045439.1 ABC transporter ATP-binding protein [Microbacterium sp. Kw_RZR3]MDF2918979.1 ABC-type multidrug transport system, ATPase and permease component [Microbacterium sp.]